MEESLSPNHKKILDFTKSAAEYLRKEKIPFILLELFPEMGFNAANFNEDTEQLQRMLGAIEFFLHGLTGGKIRLANGETGEFAFQSRDTTASPASPIAQENPYK